MAKAAEEPAAEEDAVLASGLGVGEKFKAFPIVNCDSGDEYCHPVVIPAAKEGEANASWGDHYKVTQSCTLMFADGRNQVHYAAAAPADLAELDAAIKQVLES